MRKKHFISLFCLTLFAISVMFYSVLSQLCVKTYAFSSSSEIVMDVNSGRVLYQNNANAKKFMASTTKILTAIVIIENCDLDEIVTVTKETVGVEGSSIYLEVGEKLTVKDLLYGLMLRSGNDCAETLAVHCSGSIKAFAELMNEFANKLCVKNSNFTNPHGLHDDNHYTTAYDLAVISAYAMKNPVFKEIASTKAIRIPFTTRNTTRYLKNKNKMLNDFDGATGIKTGFTKKAGRCLVSSAERNGMEIVCVVLNCPPMFERSKELLNSNFATYKPYKLVESDEIIDFVPIADSEYTCGLYVKNDVTLPLTNEEKEGIEIVYEYPKIIEKGTKKDSQVGFVKFYSQNNLIFSEKIYTIIDTD